MEMRKEMSKRPVTPGKYAGLGAAIAAKLIICFWFGVGVILAIGVVLECNMDCLHQATSLICIK